MFKEYFIYFKARKNGYIKHNRTNGRSIWAISPTAPDSVKKIGPSLPRMQAVLYSVVIALKINVLALVILVVFNIYIKST